MSCQTKSLPFGTGTLWKLLADSVFRRVLASPLMLCGDGVCVLKQLFTAALCIFRGYPAAFLGDHVTNRWEVFTHEPNRHAQALAEIARRWDGIALVLLEPRLALNRIVVLRYWQFLEAGTLAPAIINLRLAAIRKLAYEAADGGLLSSDLEPAFDG